MGRELLYQYCEANKVFHQRCGKIIIADEHQKESLMDLFHLGESKNMDNLKVLSKKEISYLEPDINGSIGLRIDSTGIIDAHGLMDHFIKSLLRQITIIYFNQPLWIVNQHRMDINLQSNHQRMI
jgi:L-2-hydroxyglutarate oxidase LhgO